MEESVDHVPADHPSDRSDNVFHRRVLDALPTAVITVDPSGEVRYANAAALDLIGRPLHRVIGADALSIIHPEDRDILLAAFFQLAAGDHEQATTVDRAWAPITFRFVHDNGTAVPVEVTGRGLLHVPEVGGIVYEIRPAHDRDLLQRVLAGEASGGGLVAQFELVLELIGAGTLEIDAAVLFTDDGETFEPVRASTDELFDALDLGARRRGLDVFAAPARSPRFVDVTSLDDEFGNELNELGYRDLWHVEVAERIGGLHYVIVGLTRVHHVPSMGVQEHLTRAAELASVIVLRVRSQQLLDRAAHHDVLTGLRNRLGLRRDVEARRTDGSPLALLYLDLDGFKTVNDEHGHHVGDEVLTVVARRLVASTAADDLVARIGGDEFAVVISPPANGVSPGRIATRLIEAIEEPIGLESGTHTVSASVGVVDVPPDVEFEQALSAADEAMYAAKAQGGGRVHERRGAG